MSRAQPIDPDVRRAKLLAAARTVFAQHGYYATSVSLITKEGGVARGTFYNYFNSKRLIFAAVLDSLMDEVTGVIEVIDVERPIPGQVVGNIRRLVSALTDPEVARLLFTEAAGIDEDGDEALRDFYRQAIARIEKALRRGQGMGIVQQGDLNLVAQFLLGMIRQPIFIASLEGKQVDADALVDEVFSVLATGVLRMDGI